jgi:hypothetical protein
MNQLMQEALTSPRVAATVSTATTTAGMATFLDWIPADIGKLATLVGICLSAVLIYIHIKRYRREEEKHKLEIAQLKRALNND